MAAARLGLVVIVAALAWAAGGGTSAAAGREPARLGAEPPEAPTRTCATRGEGRRPITAREFATRPGVRVGPVLFAGLRTLGRQNLRAGRIHPIKRPPIVRANKVVTLAIAAEDRANVGLSFLADAPVRTPEDGQSAIRLEACPADEPAFSYDGTVGYATFFPGGFIVRGTRCFTLEVWIEGRERPRRVLVRVGRDAVEGCPPR